MGEQHIDQAYDELRRLAAVQLAAERPGQTLDATALVHEAYLRLGGSVAFPSVQAYYQAAAQAMRRILIERARAKGRHKRGGGRARIELLDQASTLADDPDLLLSVDELLTRLGAEDAEAAGVAQLHLLGGLTVTEVGEALGLSRPVAYRNWKYARAWLRDALTE
ncbi:MAG TPA: ECF-type sigma factor [Gemmatales bacterium]|nr:ECF-type sigma factor [Gemmatales bacterium]